MSEGTELAPRPAGSVLTSMEHWRVMREQADVLVKSGFMPKGVDTPEKVIAIMQKGAELGVPPMTALNGIAVINGKPACSAELMAALIFRDQGGNALRLIESTPEVARYEYKRREWAKAQEFVFTLEQAKQAGLLDRPNSNWKTYPDAMLRARCVSAIARLAFPDSIGGMYTPDEVAANTIVIESDPRGGLWEEPVQTQQQTVDVATGEILEGADDALEGEAEPGGVPGTVQADIAKYARLAGRAVPSSDEFFWMTADEAQDLLNDLITAYREGAAPPESAAAGESEAPGIRLLVQELAAITGKDEREIETEVAKRIRGATVPLERSKREVRTLVARDLQGQVVRAKHAAAQVG